MKIKFPKFSNIIPRKERLKKQVEEVEKLKKEKPKEIPKDDVYTTMLVTTIDGANVMRTQARPNFPVTIEIDKETCTIKLHTNLPIPLSLNNEYNLAVMVTKDPTTANAFGTVSLGYFRHRWGFNQVRLISLNPPTFIGWRRLYKSDILLEMWE